MKEVAGQDLEQRLVILTPTGKDARLAASMLERAGVTCFGCATLDQACTELGRGAAALLMAEEVIVQGQPSCLERWLAGQLPWSDLPVLVLARQGADSALVAQAITVLGNVTVLERPVRVAALVSAVRSALRARQRQYQMREHLAELDTSAAALRDADQRKDEFLATLAHELRNPLAPIRMSVEIMKRSEDPETHKEARAVIERQTDQIVHLVDDLMDVSRITRGKINLYKEKVVLAEVMDMALETARPLLAEKDHHLILDLPVKDITLEADKTRLCQVFLNLLTNAAKYSPPGSKVRVDAKLEGQEVEVRVQDTGIGLAPESLLKVFDLFARVESGEAAKQEGLGIGLNLVKQLVTMHGGSVSVFSPGLGQGSTFTVKLPVLETQSQTAARVPETREKRADVTRRVLVVDDYEANRRTLLRMLKIMGHETRYASNGSEALETLTNFLPDVILLDINMPGMSGYEVATRIRENAKYQGIKLVALTGYGAEDDLRRAKEAGFQLHLVKPIGTNVLEDLLRNVE